MNCKKVNVRIKWQLFAILMTVLVIGCEKKPSIAEQNATQFFLAGNWTKVVSSGQKWAKEDADNPVPHALLNLAYNMLHKYDAKKAEIMLAYGSASKVAKVKKWASALADTHSNAGAYLIKGIACEVDGDNQGAVDAYLQAIKVDPSFEQGFHSLGNFYMANQKLDQAMATYKALLDRNPKCASAYDSIALVYVMKNDMPEAIQYLKKAVKLDPKNVTGWYNLANSYLETEDYENAAVAFLKVVELEPRGSAAQNARKQLEQLLQ